jgi:murein L,D-transpeptidase YafK
MRKRTGVLTWSVLILTGCLILGGCGRSRLPVAPPVAALPPAPEAPAPPLTPEQAFLKEILEKRGYNGRGYHPVVLVVSKEARKLTLYQGIHPVKTYPVVLGANPVADKLCQGDKCTPEGVYRVVTKFDHPKWNKFILLDYPNTRNWLKFAEAKRQGRIPWDADIGGEIGIHGTEDDLKNLRGENWTLGCVSLLNRHVDEIYPYVSFDTLVVIRRR